MQVTLPGNSGRVLNVRQPDRDQLRQLIDDYNANPYLSASPAGMLLDAGASRDESLLSIHCRYRPQRMEEDANFVEITAPGGREVFPNTVQLMQAVVQLIIFLPENPRSIDIVLWQHHWIHAWRLVRDQRLDTLLAEFLELIAEPVLQWGKAPIGSLLICGSTSSSGLQTSSRPSCGTDSRPKQDPASKTLAGSLSTSTRLPLHCWHATAQATMFRNIYSSRSDNGAAVWPPLQPDNADRRCMGSACTAVPMECWPRYRAVLPGGLDIPHNAFGPSFG